jgi:pimeloyl-ACP methyl ester carboxylesterase
MKSILVIFFALTIALQAVEVKKVASISVSGRGEKSVAINVPADTAELILVTKVDSGRLISWQFRNPTQVKKGGKFRDGWFSTDNINKFYRPEKGVWYFNTRSYTDITRGSLTIYAVPYSRVVKPQIIALKPHKLCDKEYIKVIFSKDIVTPTYLEGVYGFEITTNGPRMDVIGYGGKWPYYYVETDGMRNRVKDFEENFDEKNNYYFEIKRTSHSTIKHEVRINWYKAKIEAVAGVISPDRELWMVTHGRIDNPDNADDHVSFRTLAGTLSTARLAEGAPASSMVLNWSEGAADNSSDTSLEGSRFIYPVAATAKRLLNKCGVKAGGSLNLVGHSWGSLVSENLARVFYYSTRTQVARLVALDPAESGTMMGLKLGGLILGDRAIFSSFKFASNSLAIVAGDGLFGSETRATDAQVAIRLDIPDSEISNGISSIPNKIANLKKHALPVDFFYNSIINGGLASTAWAIAKDSSYSGYFRNTAPSVVKLPSALSKETDTIESTRNFFNTNKLYYQFLFKGLKFDGFQVVAGVHLDQSKRYHYCFWMGIGGGSSNNPPDYDGVRWGYY